MNIVKLSGIFLSLLGAFLFILATFLPFLNFLLDQPFNWFISLCLIFIIGGLVLHIILNKTLPLDDEDDEVIESSNISKNVEKDLEVTKVKASPANIQEDVTLVKANATKKL